MSAPQEWPVAPPARPGNPAPPAGSSRRPSRRIRLNYFKAGFIGLIGVYGLVCALSPKTYRWLDFVNLVFHEAGHVVFGFFGEIVGVLGGSLMQVLIPAIVTGYFLLHGQRWSGMVTLFWVGQSLFNVSVYVRDARAQALPLLGGEGTIHDWNWLLGRLHALHWDQALGGGIYVLGLVALAASIVGGAYFSLEETADQ